MRFTAARIGIGSAVLAVAALSIVVAMCRSSDSSEINDDGEASDQRFLARMAGDYPAYHDEHGDHTPRAKTDPRVARIRGLVSRAGTPVAGAELVATVLPIGMSWTIDRTVTGPDGRYELVVTANHLAGRQVATIYVAGGQVGGIDVEVAPGKTTERADFEVGAGFTIRGFVRDRRGAAVRGVRVIGLRGPEAVTDEQGGFALQVQRAGRHRLQVFVIHARREYELAFPVLIDVPRLDGVIAGVVLVVGEEPQGAFGARRDLPGTPTYQIKPLTLRPDGPEVVGGWCMGWSRGRDGTLTRIEESALEIHLTPDIVRLTCDVDGFTTSGRDLDMPKVSSPIEMPMVPIALNGIDLGGELRSHPAGAVVAGVTAEAQAAGLRAGDIITAVDGRSIAGFTREEAHELSFHIPPGHEVLWTVERDGQSISLRAKAPGSLQPPLYLREP